MTNTLKEAEQQISQARQQLQEQRSLAEQRRQEAERAKQQLVQEEKKLPVPSQARLRSGLYAGLEGRKRRQVLSGIRADIGKRKGEVDLFKEEIKRFEDTELKQFESQIGQRESEVAEYQRHQKSFKIAEEAYLTYYSTGKLPITSDWNTLTKKYWKEMSLKEMSTVPIEVDQPQSILIGGLPYTIATPSHKKPTSFSFTLPTPRDLSRTNLLKDFSSIGTFKIPDTSSVSGKPFLTTGSPIRFTPLLSMKPRTPPTPSRPLPKYKPKVKRDVVAKKDKYEDLFFKGKKDKDKKRKSIWGW